MPFNIGPEVIENNNVSLTLNDNNDLVIKQEPSGAEIRFEDDGTIDPGTAGPVQVPELSSDPASPSDGDVWYNTAADEYRGQENGTIISFNTTAV